MSLIKGIDVILHKKTPSDTDPFGRTEYTYSNITVSNVIIEPIDGSEVVDNTSLNGQKLRYRLHIPKDDTNDWNDVKVTFYGKTFKTYGIPIEYMEHLTPLDWNKKVTVEYID